LSALFRLRKTGRRLISDSKGFSSIVGAVFAVLVMISLISTVFVWSLSQNTLYNNTVTQTRQADLDRSNEKTVVLNTTYTPYNNSNVNVYAQIQNIGSSSIQFITVWLYMSNSTPWTNYNFSSLVNANVQGGSTFTLNVNLTATGVNSNSTYSISSWLITARGNTVALQRTIVFANNIIVSQTTQGIGALMMDFQNFTCYKVKQSGPSYYLDFSSETTGYTVKKSDAPVAFRVILTDLDTQNRNINLSLHSEFFSIFPSTGGNYKAATWYIVNVDPATGVILTPFNSQILNCSSATSVYFASKSEGSFTTVDSNDMFLGTCPINLALVGTIGTSPFGQNIPFVSIYVS